MATHPFIHALKQEGASEGLISVFESVSRERYIDSGYRKFSGENRTFPTMLGEETDDPVTLMKMLQLLAPSKSWKVLEVGTGLGWSTAILSSLAGEVVTVEYHEELALRAKENLKAGGVENVRILAGDGTEQPADEEGFDGIIVHAASLSLPVMLMNQLRAGGRMVFPMGPAVSQQLIRFAPPLEDADDSPTRHVTFHDVCRFNSIRGFYGWIDIDDEYITDEAQV